MTSVTIGDVPDETRDELAARAAATGRSLQEYLRGKLIELAGRPDPEALLCRLGFVAELPDPRAQGQPTFKP
ncbi:MAG: FitA-like ribbon-helix-helix domain-containing protein [Acidimicrobiales bacterium]